MSGCVKTVIFNFDTPCSIMFSFFRKKTDPTLFWQTDVHSHLCPGIDDGACDIAHSRELVQRMQTLGFKRFLITPHITEETFPNNPESIGASFAGLRQALPGVEMAVSAEYRIDKLLYDAMESRELLPWPSGYILIENGWFQEPMTIESIIFRLRNEHGLKPVLAHPERFRYYQAHPERLEYLHSKGAMLQVNLLSLAGYYGKSEKKLAEALLSRGLVSFVGSDVHRTRHIEVIAEYLHTADYEKLRCRSDLILNDTLDWNLKK